MLVKTLTNEPYRRVHFIYQKIFQCKSLFCFFSFGLGSTLCLDLVALLYVFSVYKSRFSIMPVYTC